MLKNACAHVTSINSVTAIFEKGADKVGILLIGSLFIMTSQWSCDSGSNYGWSGKNCCVRLRGAMRFQPVLMVKVNNAASKSLKKSTLVKVNVAGTKVYHKKFNDDC